MIPLNLAGAKVAALAAAAGLLVGGGLAYGWFSPRLELERVRAQGLGDRLTQQNRAIEALEESAKTRQEVIGRLLDVADRARKEADASARELRSRPQPAGTNACEAADALITEELAR